MAKADDKNMELWDSVFETDPAYTKKVTTRGGFTAINAQYQLRSGTEKWGPYGIAWGLRDCVYGYVFNGAGDWVVNLPEIDVVSIGVCYGFINATTNVLTLDAADYDYVDRSGIGDTIYSGEGGVNTNSFSSIFVMQITTNWWFVPQRARGTWTYTD